MKRVAVEEVPGFMFQVEKLMVNGEWIMVGGRGCSRFQKDEGGMFLGARIM